MTFKLPDLPYQRTALAPHVSEETLDYHHGKHHQVYVDTLNDLVEGTKWEDTSLDEIVRTASGKLFNQAAQHWNHSFYWNCMSPDGGRRPGGGIGRALERAFGSFEAFAEEFKQAATDTFGSGWAWLVRKEDGTLAVTSTENAGNPLTRGDKPLLTCDVWEHAYYIDYRNARPEYVGAFFELVNWNFVQERFAD